MPEGERGTYLGMSHPAVIEHLRGLGVTAVELMPVHQFVSDAFLTERGLGNYWGYNTIGFFAPHNASAFAGSHGEQVQEFKSMARALHQAGIEVILDVVYNHTAEGNHLGPTLSLRGIDNAAYYRLVDDDRRYYYDTTGTSLTVFLNGDAITEADRRGQPIRDDSFLLLFNASPHELEFTVPAARYGEEWETVLDTARPGEPFEDTAAVKAGGLLPVRDRCMLVLRRW